MSKTRLAVIGGGVGAVTAVYALARDPDLARKYEITVYQMGWRLGGKGASGRQADAGERILEHGLHVWAGFYDNAFRLLDDCYGQLGKLGLRDPDSPLSTMDAAFKPLEHLFLAEHVEIEGEEPFWRPWLIDLPENNLRPGEATSAPTPFDMLLRMLSIVKTFFDDGEFAVSLRSGLGPEQHAKLTRAHDALHGHAHRMPKEPARHGARQTSLLVSLIEDVQKVVHDLQTPAFLKVDAMRRIIYLADLSLAYARGMAASDAFVAGYDVLDQWEFTAWLRRNGAGEHALNSVLLRGCYDFVFGYPHGRGLHGDVGAGTAIRAMSRLLLSYRGSIFQEMQAGMGDTIFAPYYQVLHKLGVKFRFFNAARRLRLDPTGAKIAALDMVEQARVEGGGEYRPLKPVKDLPCWPSEPLWDQLADGHALRDSGVDFESEAQPPSGRAYTLKAGEDFDEVLLGASLGSLPYLTEELSAKSPRWRRMTGSLRSVATCAAQFWLREPQDALGWRALVDEANPEVKKPDGPLRTVITGFGEPLDTWADMSHLLEREDWKGDGPASIAYFCSPAPDGLTLDAFETRVRSWMNDELTQLWTGAEKPSHAGFRMRDLHALPDKHPFESQYYRVNQFGSERYVLSVTGSVYHRLAPGESGFERLTLAGDWTRCGLNAGCVEAATMSGLAAAEAISGKKMLIVGADDIEIDESLQARAKYMSPDVTSASWPLSGFYARGEMTGWFIFHAMPRAEVEALLPPGLHLAPTDLAGPGMHPVGVSFCRYHDVRGSFVPDFMAFEPYGEATFAIPFVRSEEAGRARFLYPRRLYVNSDIAIAAGRICYSMDKVKSRIEVDDRSFRAWTPRGDEFLQAHFVQQEDPRPLAEHPAFGSIARILDLPFVTKGRFGDLYNAFDMQLDHGWAAPVSGHVTCTDDQPGGFPHFRFDATPLQPDHPEGLPGAVRVWCSWSLTNPFDSRRIRDAARAQSWLRRTY